MLKRIISPAIPLQRLVSYGRHNSQGLILWKYNRACRRVSTSSLATPGLLRRVQSDALKTPIALTYKDLEAFSDKLHASKSSEEQEKVLIQSAEFLRQQVPIRLAHVLVALQNLPYGANSAPSIKKVYDLYLESYESCSNFPEINTPELEKGFADLILTRLKEHLVVRNSLHNINKKYSWFTPHFSPFFFIIKKKLNDISFENISFLLQIVPHICMGLLETAEQNPMIRIEETPYLNDFVDRICHLRVSLRILLGHHIQVRWSRTGVCKDTDVSAYVEEAASDATIQCEKYFGEAPKVNINDKRKQKHFIYIPEHLHHISYELLKNSMRAVCETHPNDLKPIDIRRRGKEERGKGSKKKKKVHKLNILFFFKKKKVIVDTPQTVTIKIADKGGGIPRADMEKIWLYSYTTAVDPYGRTRKELFELLKKEAQQALNRDILMALKNTPMFGLGYGLPVARLYARYYGGDCEIFSVHGYGTDAYLHLNDLSKSKSPLIL
ncbi:hypothetical protein RFI_25733 [Reticulomyxa filosa]|uniref:Protein-serine/threonine kinase n=1 Tax=Reticulomyxa filosa TaxID=46433 RepID=X6MDY8_RETFI|nr:hypothetical protein RFI_25733 [Reticulomyxa filosa]|eukprot:ETO11642.1 hypothetical protein RFI_25733 [Reticulomyxa filosa]